MGYYAGKLASIGFLDIAQTVDWKRSPRQFVISCDLAPTNSA